MMLVAIVLPQCGNCFKLLVAQHVVGVLQMVSSAGYCVLMRTIGVARCRVRRIGVDVQQSSESNGHCCSGRCLLQCCDICWVMVLQLGLVSVYSIDDVRHQCCLRHYVWRVALVAQWLCVAFNRCTMKAASMCWNGRLSVRMSACACS